MSLIVVAVADIAVASETACEIVAHGVDCVWQSLPVSVAWELVLSTKSVTAEAPAGAAGAHPSERRKHDHRNDQHAADQAHGGHQNRPSDHPYARSTEASRLDLLDGSCGWLSNLTNLGRYTLAPIGRHTVHIGVSKIKAGTPGAATPGPARHNG